MVQNKSLIFKSVPNGWPVPGKDLAIETRNFDDSATPPTNGFTAKVLFSSFDPYMRGRMRAPEAKSYRPPFTLGEPFVSGAIAQILKSRNPSFKEGDTIEAFLPCQQYVTIENPEAVNAKKLDTNFAKNTTGSTFLGALGMPGLTAYSSFYAIGKPKKGETIFVSAASGAVGQIVGQLAKHEGLRVVGSVGSQEKLDFITKTLGFDGGFNYKTEKPSEALERLAPDGVDIYYENVGGEQLDAALNAMNVFGRIVASGMISQYNAKPEELYGVKSMMQVVAKRLTIRGFIVSDADMGPIYIKEHREKVGGWIADGSFKALESVTDGIEKAPEGFVGMLKGENFGKAVLKI